MPENEVLRTEYIEVGQNWRFLVNVRFKMLGFFLTLITGLGIAFTLTDADFRFFITIAGLVSSISIWIMEKRNRTLYRIMMDRGVKLEARLGITDGQYRLLQESWNKDKWKEFILTQSNVIDLLCSYIILFWVGAMFIPLIKRDYPNYLTGILIAMILIMIVLAVIILRRNISGTQRNKQK